MGADIELCALDDPLLRCAKAAIEPNKSVKQKVSETKILKPDIFTSWKCAAAEFARSAAEQAPHLFAQRFRAYRPAARA